MELAEGNTETNSSRAVLFFGFWQLKKIKKRNITCLFHFPTSSPCRSGRTRNNSLVLVLNARPSRRPGRSLGRRGSTIVLFGVPRRNFMPEMGDFRALPKSTAGVNATEKRKNSSNPSEKRGVAPKERQGPKERTAFPSEPNGPGEPMLQDLMRKGWCVTSRVTPPKETWLRFSYRFPFKTIQEQGSLPKKETPPSRVLASLYTTL